MTPLLSAIESEINRLDASGISVYFDDDLPRGWVRVTDESCTVYGAADELLEALKSIDCDLKLDFKSLREFDKHQPSNSRDWPQELIHVRRLGKGDANDNPDTLIIVKCNAGTRYAAGPHGVSYCALSDWFRSGDSLAATAAKAISLGCT